MGLIHSCKTLAKLHSAKKSFNERKERCFLNYLFWETTLRCNLTCRHCGSRCGPNDPCKDELTTKEAKDVFSQIAQSFNARDITVAVTGGEPLLRKDLFSVMSHVRDLGFWWGLVTNGTLVTKKVAQKLKKAGMATVSISIDGDAEAHAFLRGSKESFEKGLNSVSILREANFLDRVQVTTVVHQKNVHLLEKMYDIFHKRGCQEWRLLMADPIGRMTDPENRDFILKGDELKTLLDYVAEKRENPGPMEVTFEESGFLGLDYEGRVRDYFFHCPAGIEIASVLADGAISACPSLPRTLVEGNVRQDDFAKVWQEGFQRYRDRENTRRKGVCESCMWWQYCEGGSLHLWDWEKEETRLCHYKLLNET